MLERAIHSRKHTPEYAEVDDRLLGVPSVHDQDIIGYH